MIPQILNDVVDILKKEKISIAEKIEGEGRGGSLQDEGTIVRFLQSDPVIGKYVIEQPARAFGDMLVIDPVTEERYVVNIKTSIGSSDNATSKLGFLYALTDMAVEELPYSMGWKKFDALLKSRKADIPQKDYWFLSVDKNDSSQVMIRGAKQIANYGENANPANLLQINWKKEKVSAPVQRTYDEAYDVLVGGIKRSFAKFLSNLPEDWRDELCG
jgi:hypothetical protein